MRRQGLMLAGLLLMIAAAAMAFAWLSKPAHLRLAVGPIGSEDVRLAAGLVQAAQREKGPIRLRLALVDDPRGAARALDEGKVDLAVVRSDAAMPEEGLTSLVLRRSHSILIVKADRGFERIADLKGKTIAAPRDQPDDLKLLRTILDHYEFSPDAATILPLPPNEFAAALREGRADAVFLVGSPSSRRLSKLIGSLTRAVGGAGVSFVPVRESQAIAALNRALESSELISGAFGGEPPRPSAAVPTLSVTTRLMAHRTLADDTVGELVKFVLNARQPLSAEIGSAQAIETPSTEKDAALPTHPGAAAYIDGEQETFFERYGDWFYLGVMALSIVGSAAAAFVSRMRSTRRDRAMEGLRRLLKILHEARTAGDAAQLHALESEIDAILSDMLIRAADDELDTAALSATRIAVDQAMRAIAERRDALDRAPAEQEVAPPQRLRL
ncbi:MAG: TAXI family TRAP transporter solute-binding subunit [Beijerinckiaceae bacterium]